MNPQPGDVPVTLADNGAIVTVPLGRRLVVTLDAGYSGPVWSEIDAGPALHRALLDVQRPRSSAAFTASRPTSGEQVTATGPSPWSVTVVVPDGAGTADPATCSPRTIPTAYDRLLVLTDADDGRTVQVDRGDTVAVVFAGCRGGFDLRPAVATGPLSRYRARGSNPGGASAIFATSATGTATISSTTDDPCAHLAMPCLAPQRSWHVTVQVTEPCRLTGPADVPAGTDAFLTGRFTPGATVRVAFRPYGGSAFTTRRTLTADAYGFVQTSYRAVVDQRWYATGDGCTSAAGLTRVTPTVSGPATVRRGASVPVVVRGPAGAAVQMWFRSAGGAYALRRSGRLDAAGTYRTSYVADADQRYYAVTGPDRRVSPPALTVLG